MGIRTFTVIAAFFVLTTPLAAAHATKAIGDGTIRSSWGMLNEPVVTMTKNGLDIIIRDNATNAGIGGLEGGAVTVELHYGDEELAAGALTTQFGKGPGNYTTAHPITPTKAGIYVLHLMGKINGQDIDVAIEAAHPVQAIDETYFPELKESLEARVAALEAKAKTQSETPATATTLTGTPAKPAPAASLALIAIAVALVAIGLRQRS